MNNLELLEEERLLPMLEEAGIVVSGENFQLPEIFLMEMTAISDHLTELESDPDEKVFGILKTAVVAAEEEMLEEAAEAVNGYDPTNADAAVLEKLKIFYFKRKFLLQIKERVSIFASRN
ncbi:hypothetical protein [Chitinophaga niastensis]|nr:hypothetical protein [Chitinophaga niastensis]